MGVSQPTVSRLIKKLQKEKYIQEYSAIPDLSKLGYKILALTFVKLRKPLTSEEIEKAREVAMESLRKGPFEIVMLERGIGLGYDGTAVSYHTDYTSYVKLMNWFKAFGFLDVEKLDSFLIDLEGEIRYRPFTLRTLAEHILAAKEEKEE